jgi:hypothetical protein
VPNGNRRRISFRGSMKSGGEIKDPAPLENDKGITAEEFLKTSPPIVHPTVEAVQRQRRVEMAIL